MQNFNIYNVLIVLGVIQGIILSVFILTFRKYRTKSAIYLGFLMLAITCSNLYYWLRDTNLLSGWDNYFLLNIHTDVVILPLFYLFVVTYLQIKSRFKNYVLIPFYIRLTAHILTILYVLFAEYFINIPIRFKAILHKIDGYTTIAFMLFMIMLVVATLIKFEKHNQKNIPTRWIKKILAAGLVLTLLFVLCVVSKDFIPVLYNFEHKYYFLWISLSAIIYWLGYAGIYNLELLKHNKSYISQTTNKNQTNSKFEGIDDKIKTESLYKNPNLSLNILSELFDLSEGYISQIINQNTNSNFATYINNYRIENAKNILQDSNFKNYTIVSIALESGFNSKSAFYVAFKKHTGQSPTAYRNQYYPNSLKP